MNCLRATVSLRRGGICLAKQPWRTAPSSIMTRRHASQAAFEATKVLDAPTSSSTTAGPDISDWRIGDPIASTPDSTSDFTFAVKDNIATLDGTTTCGSALLRGHVSPYEATVVSQLKRLGGRLVAKTNLDEFGMGSHSTHSHFGAAAWIDATTGVAHSAGGSSGGSALAVRQGLADVALGTDTGGSVRLPAAYTGVVGYKPSYGMVSRFGVVPYANSLDTVGLLAREVAPIRKLVLGGLCDEHDAKDPTSLTAETRKRCRMQRTAFNLAKDLALEPGMGQEQMRNIKIGIPKEYNIEELDEGVRNIWRALATLLRDQCGANVRNVSLPTTRHALSTYYVIAPAEASSNLAKYDGVRYGSPAEPESETKVDGSEHILYAKTRSQGFGDEVKRRILLGAYTLSSEAMDNYFIQAQRVRRLVRRDFDRVFKLDNPLIDEGPFDLAEMDEGVELENKQGPPQVDFLLCPTTPTSAPTLDEVRSQQPVDAYMNDVFTVPASLAGLPAISIPIRVKGAAPGSVGEFVGMQLIGQFWDDARLLSLAQTIMGLENVRNGLE